MRNSPLFFTSNERNEDSYIGLGDCFFFRKRVRSRSVLIFRGLTFDLFLNWTPLSDRKNVKFEKMLTLSKC